MEAVALLGIFIRLDFAYNLAFPKCPVWMLSVEVHGLQAGTRSTEALGVSTLLAAPRGAGTPLSSNTQRRIQILPWDICVTRKKHKIRIPLYYSGY